MEGTSKWERYGVMGESVAETRRAVTQLCEDTYYEFRVAAENRAGQGPFSDVSEHIRTLIGQCCCGYFIYSMIVYELYSLRVKDIYVIYCHWSHSQRFKIYIYFEHKKKHTMSRMFGAFTDMQKS